MATSLLLQVAFFALVNVCGCLEWTSADMPNGTTLTRCKGDNVSLAWSFATAPGETVMSVHWFFSNGVIERNLAMFAFGHFFPFPGSNRTLDFLPNAGFTLYNVTVSDFGLYSVRVNWNQRGSLSTSTQFASLSLPDVPVIEGDHLTATVVPQPMWIADTQLWHMSVECGKFAELGTPPASVLWQTPTMEIVESSFESNGSFYLVLGNPVEGGLYTCFLDKSSPTLGCTKGFPNPQTTSAHVQVDAGELRLLVLETRVQEENHHIRAQLEEKDAMVANLTSELDRHKQSAEQQEDRLSKLTSASEKQSELVSSLASELERQKQVAEEQELRIANLTSKFERQKQVAEEQERHIANLTSELEQQKDLVAILRSGQEDLVAGVTSQIGEQKKALTSLTSDLGQQKDLVATVSLSLEGLLANVTSELEGQKSAVSNLKSELDEQEQLAKQHDETCSSKLSELDQQTELVKNLRSNLQQQTKFVANLTSRTEKQDYLMATLTSASQERDKMVSNLTSALGRQDDAMANLTSRYEQLEKLAASLVNVFGKKSCADIRNWTSVTEVYNADKNIQVMCEDGWTLIQRRMDGSVDFYRGWDDYVQGFGDLRGEFWLGLDSIYRLTTSQRHSLRIDMENKDGKRAFAEYTEFNISSEADKYRLYVGDYFGTAGDSLRYHSGHQFSTRDRDHDIYESTNCAVTRQGAWWYRKCDESNLNGPYRTPGRSGDDGVIWDLFGGGSLKTVTMKIRPQHF